MDVPGALNAVTALFSLAATVLGLVNRRLHKRTDRKLERIEGAIGNHEKILASMASLASLADPFMEDYRARHPGEQHAPLPPPTTLGG